jgi:hypothetical protein
MDAAAMAAASDPTINRHFRRRWAEPPPHKRERPALGGTSNRAKAEIVSSSAPTHTATDRTVQRAIAAAETRADRLDRRATALRSIGHHAPARRLATIAARIRAEVLT